jgi:hypothetical protein
MEFPSKEKIEMIKKNYPVDCKVMIDFMDDPYGIPSGSIGTVRYIDSIGQIHLKEYGLALVYGVDRFHKI